MTLANKTILVTGVSSGIGMDFAKLARLQGATVIGIDRKEPGLTLDAFIQADLGEPTAIDAAVAQLPNRIDAVANIAGVPGTAPVDLVARVNFLGLRHLTLAVLPHMPSGSAIVNIASILGAHWPERLEHHRALAATPSFAAGLEWLATHPVDQSFGYQYFKEVLIVWTLTQWQKEFLRRGVRMNCVAPGPVMTPILTDFITMLGDSAVKEDAKRIKRPAFSDEISPPIGFLCDDASRWISGAIIPVDGGMSSTYV